MSDLSSDSSDSEQDPVNTVENENHSLSLNAVNDCIREYEKEQKKELRKKRFDAKGPPTSQLIVSVPMPLGSQFTSLLVTTQPRRSRVARLPNPVLLP